MEKTAAAAEPTSAAERTASPGWGKAHCNVIEIGEGDSVGHGRSGGPRFQLRLGSCEVRARLYEVRSGLRLGSGQG